MGAIQVEVLDSLLRSRFGLQATFDPPTVIYRETPARSGEGFEAYTMPKPCWAILRFLIEPGVHAAVAWSTRRIVPANRLLPPYQREVERRVPEALTAGPAAAGRSPTCKVTLIDGEHHIYHTHPLDWYVATPMAIMNGLAATGTTLLEPLYRFRLTVPEEMAGRVLGDLIRMRAVFETAADPGRAVCGGGYSAGGHLAGLPRAPGHAHRRPRRPLRPVWRLPAGPARRAAAVSASESTRWTAAKYILSVRGAL